MYTKDYCVSNMSIEQTINYQLNKLPKVKKIIKRGYQLFFYFFSKKEPNSGNLVQLTPNDGNEYFFGYYDKSPWDISDRYVLCLQVKCTWKDVAPKEPANVVVIDTENNNTMRFLGQTHTWNVQQGCILQWLGPDYQRKIIYNDFRDNHYCSIVFSIDTLEERVINLPAYSVAKSGEFALTLDFSRLHRLRKGYGYSNLLDKTMEKLIPESPCIWKIDLISGNTMPLLYYNDFYEFETRKEMEAAEHKVNHIMISPSGNRFMVLHRWIHGQRKYSRLVTCNMDGTGMYNLLDDDMVSHCNWKNDNEIIAFANKRNFGIGYYLLKDKSQEFKKLWPGLDRDGHPSYSPDKSLIVTDTYPDRTRMSSVYCMSEDSDPKIIARVFSPFKYDNDVRCDLHPRWNHEGNRICFDSIIMGHRGLYIMKASK